MIAKYDKNKWYFQDEIPKGQWSIALDGAVDTAYPLNINLQPLYDNLHQFVDKIEAGEKTIKAGKDKDKDTLKDWIFNNCLGAEMKVVFDQFLTANLLSEETKKK